MFTDRHRLLWLVPAALCVSGCGEVFVAPPPQRIAEPHAVREILDMTPGRPAELWGSPVSGIHPGGDPNADWRWAGERSVFDFRLDEPGVWSLTARLTAAKTALDRVGPQRVSFAVNGQAAGSVALDVSRTYDLSFPVAEAILGNTAVTQVVMTAGPCVSQRYGPPYCVLLHKIGFVQEPR